MTREDFLKRSISMGIGLPFLSALLLESCNKEEIIFPNFQTNFSGKVLIIGAGAAGLSAGYVLNRYGVDFEIIEASSVFGGRLKQADGFADFPIDIGAEWIHTHPSILTDIINNPKVNNDIDIIVYNPQTFKVWNNEKLKSHNYIRNLYSEWKFKNTTWYGFFEKYIVPDIFNKIVLNKPIVEIDYSTDKVRLKTSNNETYEADKILITTPIKTLQNQQILFSPTLPTKKLDAINSISMGDGLKIFVEFKERFYPDVLTFGNLFEAISAEEKYVYDAAFRKNSSKHILGLFAINDKARAYTQLSTEDEIINKFLGELDEIFEGKASANYVQHIIQNWSKEPYIQGAYSYSFDGDQKTIVDVITDSIENKIYFAGEAYSINHQATVHGACESAYAMVEKILKNE